MAERAGATEDKTGGSTKRRRERQHRAIGRHVAFACKLTVAKVGHHSFSEAAVGDTLGRELRDLQVQVSSLAAEVLDLRRQRSQEVVVQVVPQEAKDATEAAEQPETVIANRDGLDGVRGKPQTPAETELCGVDEQETLVEQASDDIAPAIMHMTDDPLRKQVDFNIACDKVDAIR